MGSRFSELWESLREAFRRVNVRDEKTQLGGASILAAIVLIAALFALPGSDDKKELASGSDEPVATDKAAEEDTKTAEPGETPTASAAAAEVAGDLVDNPDAELDYARRLAAQISPVTTSLPNGNPNTWPGVTKDTIKFVLSYDKANCGTNLVNALSAAGANFSTEGRYFRAAPSNADEANRETVEAVNSVMKYYNQRGYEAAQEFPKIKPLIGNDKTRPFYGRKVVHEFVDGGSFQCPETTTAAAVEIVQDRKPFAVFNNFDGASYNMAEALHAKAPANKRPMHFGSLWLSDKEYERWSPYTWTQFTSGTKAADLYASYVCKRLVGKKAVRSPQYKDQTRKFALLYPALQEARNVANDVRRSIKKHCGRDIYAGTGGDQDRVIEYSTDLSRAADEGTTTAIRLKLEGVTSLTYLMDPVFPLFQILAQKGQSYRPEYVWTPTGYYDSSTVQRLYDQEQINGNSFGISMFGVPGGYGFEAGDSFFIWHDQHKVAPNGRKCDPSSDAGMSHSPEYCKAPSAIVTWLYTTLPSLAGILFAGPDLTPAHVTEGLQRVPTTRFGPAGATEKPFAALLGAGKGRYYFIVDATEYRWRATYVSPPPETKLGWVEYPDCQRHYNLWPDHLSQGWEKGGPNYTAYCGDPKYAPAPYVPKGPDNETCADAPGDKCEKDGYPRWKDW
ncbi:MAG: hypothetical protein WD646_00435 [Actinomycetota bacterium]